MHVFALFSAHFAHFKDIFAHFCNFSTLQYYFITRYRTTTVPYSKGKVSNFDLLAEISISKKFQKWLKHLIILLALYVHVYTGAIKNKWSIVSWNEMIMFEPIQKNWADRIFGQVIEIRDFYPYVIAPDVSKKAFSFCLWGSFHKWHHFIFQGASRTRLLSIRYSPIVSQIASFQIFVRGKKGKKLKLLYLRLKKGKNLKIWGEYVRGNFF